MADFTDDATAAAAAARRNAAPLPPFVAPKSGARTAHRAPRPVAPPPAGYVPPARLYTPPAVPTVTPVAATPAEAEMPAYVSPTSSTALDGPTSEPLEVSAPTLREPEVETQGESELDAYTAAPAQVAGADHAHEQPVAEVDDDWFAAETSESGATQEPADPTPAFNDLHGIERLASNVETDGSEDVGAAAEPESGSAEHGSLSQSVGAVENHAPNPRTEVAELLERVALRVRDGELAIPPDVAASNDAAALAAVLTALLRSPRE